MLKTTVWRVLRKRLVFKPYHHGEHYGTPCIYTYTHTHTYVCPTRIVRAPLSFLQRISLTLPAYIHPSGPAEHARIVFTYLQLNSVPVVTAFLQFVP
jgi:hypothetical protein